MFAKLTLAVTFGAGYVLGAKAGRQRYTQLQSRFRDLAGMPAVQSASTAVKDAASGMAESAKATVNEKVEAVSHPASSGKTDSGLTIDLDRHPASPPV